MTSLILDISFHLAKKTSCIDEAHGGVYADETMSWRCAGYLRRQGINLSTRRMQQGSHKPARLTLSHTHPCSRPSALYMFKM